MYTERFRGLTGPILGPFLLVLLFNSSASAQKVTYSGGFQYANGSYFFTEQTESIYLTNGFSIAGDRSRIWFSVPFIIQNTPWISYNREGGIPTGGTGHGQVGNMGRDMMGNRDRDRIHLPDTTSYKQASFSDPSLGGSWIFFRSESRNTVLNLNGSVKFPLATPQSGFGTGELDFSTGVSATHRINKIYFFGDVTYWYLGDMNDLNLENPLAVIIGTGMMSEKWIISAQFYASTKIIDEFDPPASVSVGTGYFISSWLSLSGSLLFGLSESSPGVSAGVGWSVNF